MINIDHFEKREGGRDAELQCPAGQYDTLRTKDQALPIPALDLHDMNRRLVERAARIDRHDLIGLATDHDLIVWPGRQAQIRRGDSDFPIPLLDQPCDLARAVLPPAGLDRIALYRRRALSVAVL